MSKRILVLVHATAPERVREALRGALGLSLRGDRIHVVLQEPIHDDRALDTLLALGHLVQAGEVCAEDIAAADAVEVWT